MLKYLAIIMFALSIQSQYANAAATSSSPAAPSYLVASGTKVINLSWIDNSNNEEFFFVDMGYAPISATNTPLLTRIGVSPANRSTYTFSSTTPGMKYYFRVSASNASGTSTSTNMVIVIVTGNPASPSNLSAIAYTATGSSPYVNITWRDNSSDEHSFRIDQVVVNNTVSPRGTVSYINYIPLATVAANATGYAYASGTPGKTYNIIVRAVNQYGLSGNSNYTTFTFPRR